MSLSIREDGTQIIRLEEIVFVKKGKVNVIKKYILNSSYEIWRSGRLAHEKCSGNSWLGLWKGISMGSKRFLHYIHLKVGDGSQVQFWHDIWCGDQLLRMAFPDLYICSL